MIKIWQSLLLSILISATVSNSVKETKLYQLQEEVILLTDDNDSDETDLAIDLEKIKFITLKFNFNKFNIDQLKEWILKDIAQTFEFNKIDLNYQEDYDVSPLDEKTLEEFLENTDYIDLTFTIYSQDTSEKAKNSTTLQLINDQKAEFAPSEPPKPEIKPNPDDKTGNKKENLTIMTVIAVLVISSLLITVFFKYHFKRGIGFKKRKTIQNSKNKLQIPKTNDSNKTSHGELTVAQKELKKIKAKKNKKLSPKEKYLIELNRELQNYQKKIEGENKKTKNENLNIEEKSYYNVPNKKNKK